MKIAVAGTGYVGLSIATLLSQHHEVMAVDIIPEKVELINQRKSPIQDEYIEKYLAEKDLNLTATLDAEAAYKDADFVVIAAPTSYDSNKTGEVWKHDGTVDTDVTMTGTKPELTLSYDPAIGDNTYYNGGNISTKTDIPVKVTAKIGSTDVTSHVAFVHEKCSTSCGFDGSKEQFLIHVKTCSLTVTKTGGEGGEPYVMNIYKGGELYTSMTIVGNSSATVKELPVGTYTVQEDTKWAWRYNNTPEISGGVALSKDNVTGTITVTNRDRYSSFLNGYSTVVQNVYGKILDKIN